MSSHAPSVVAAPPLDRLAAIVGVGELLLEEAARELHATDVFGRGAMPLAVVRPGTVEELRAVVAACHDSATPLTVRGAARAIPTVISTEAKAGSRSTPRG